MDSLISNMSEVAAPPPPPPPPPPPAATERIPPPRAIHRRDVRPRRPQKAWRATEGDGAAPPGGPKPPEKKPAPASAPQSSRKESASKQQEENEKESAPNAKLKQQEEGEESAPKPKKQFLPDLPVPASFRDAEWFAASGGDLRFVHMLLGRAQGLADVSVMRDAETLARVYPLYVVGKKVLQELQGRSVRQADGDGDDDEAGEQADEAEQKEDDETSAAASPVAGGEGDATDRWSVASIMEEVRGALTASRVAILQHESEHHPNAKKPKRSIERVLVKELTENATELLLSRAGYDDIPVLEAWLAFVSQDPAELKKQVESAAIDAENPEASEEAVGLAADDAVAPAEGSANPSKRGIKRQQKQQRQVANGADAIVCNHVRVCIAFLRECHAVAAGNEVRVSTLLSLQPPAFQVSPKLKGELRNLFAKQRISDADEGERLGVAQYLQQVLRRGGDKWRHCNLVLFGSSLSLYGSTGSDMDLCLLRTPTQSSASDTNMADGATKTVVGIREIRAILNGKAENESGDGGLDMVAAQELILQVKKSIEKIAVLYHGLSKGGADACSHPQLKQLQQMRFIRAHYGLLQDAIRDRVSAISANEADGHETARAVAAAAVARRKELILKSKRQSDDMFRVRAILERSNCKVRMVISGARIPIIRFQHLPTKLDCDMCFENVLATRNTFLLRAYAKFDERARMLGIAVKHWAKQRAINDASVGFLSSYSFVLLTVYFLQAVAGVLPNLQDPELLESAHVAPDVYNGVNIAFCTKLTAARTFHANKLRAVAKDLPSRAMEHSPAALLAWFFEFYATKFDFSRHVISIRAPHERAEKQVKWGVQKSRSWRISIQDPLETSRDLGSVLKFKGQEKILHEFKRAHELLKAGKSFVEIAEAESVPTKTAIVVESKSDKKPTRATAATSKDSAHSEDAGAKPKASNKNTTTTNSGGNTSNTADTVSSNNGVRGGSEKPRQAPRNHKSDNTRKERATPVQRGGKPNAPAAAEKAT